MGNIKYLLVSLLFIGIGVGISNYMFAYIITIGVFERPLNAILAAIIGIFAFLNLLVGTAYLWISTQRIAKHHNLYSALRLFVLKYHRLYVGKRMLKKIRSSFKNPREAQEQLLRDIIRKNKDTDYGRQFKLVEINSLDDFRKKHPLTHYDRYKKFVERIAKGEQNVMTSARVTRLTTTSGTTGKIKLIPQDEYDSERMFSLLEALQHELFPNFHPMQAMLKVHINGKIKRSEGGITTTNSTALEPHMMKNMDMYTPPNSSRVIDSLNESFYVALLFALRDRELGAALIIFASTIVDLMRFLKEHWEDLVNDLSEGSIKEDLDLSREVRVQLLKSLGSGDHQRAMEVKEECERGFNGIMKRLWPNLEFISTVDPGGLRDSLEKSVAKGVTIHCSMYPCTEGCPVGLNFWPFQHGHPEYALIPTRHVYEFIKEEEMDKPDPPTYFLHEVKVGQRYELVLTQDYGLYRFRFGDVIEVSGYHQNCPKIKVMYRKASLLNMTGEKVDQITIKEAVNSALEKWGDRLSLVHYSVAESSIIPDDEGLHYVFFIELKSRTNGTDLPDDLNGEHLGQDIEKYLYDNHTYYRNRVNSKQLTPVKVHITKPGAFNELREYMLSHSSASRAQFKMPLKLRTEELAKEMLRLSLD